MIFAHRVNVQSGTWRDFVLTHVPHPKYPIELPLYSVSRDRAVCKPEPHYTDPGYVLA